MKICTFTVDTMSILHHLSKPAQSTGTNEVVIKWVQFLAIVNESPSKRSEAKEKKCMQYAGLQKLLQDKFSKLKPW